MARNTGIIICVGFAERDSESKAIFNSLVCLSEQGEILAVYRKTHLFDEEKDYFISGNQAIIAETAIGRIGFSICYDFEFPEWPRINALQGAQLLLVSSANMEPWAEDQEIYAKARAMENQMFVALANRVGKDDRFLFCGNSIVVDPRGNTLQKADKDNSALLLANLDFERLEAVRNSSINYLIDRRYDIYGMIGEAFKPNND
jgi:predicted amidohydrolase